jgi:hypothetical protein
MAASSRGRTSTEEIERWRRHIESCKHSGLSQEAYCRQHGISKSTLGYWKRRFERDAAGGGIPTVVPVPMHLISESGSAESLRLHIGERYRIDIREDFNPALLEKLLRTLERLE